MKNSKFGGLFASLVVASLMLFQGQALANLTLNITQNTTLGGTDWSFSGGSGTIGASASSYFLVGETTANPQDFSTFFASDTSLTVLSGVNTFGITKLFNHNYGGLSGTNGSIYDGLDFQGTGLWSNQALSLFNGLVLNANSISYASFNPGTYTMDSYYSGYNTNFGTFTLIVGPSADVPEPATLALLGFGLAGLGLTRRRKVQQAAV